MTSTRRTLTALVAGLACGAAITWSMWPARPVPRPPPPPFVPDPPLAALDPFRRHLIELSQRGENEFIQDNRWQVFQPEVAALPDGWFSVMQLDETERRALVDAWANLPLRWAEERTPGAWVTARNGVYSEEAARAWVLDNAESVRGCVYPYAAVPGDLRVYLYARRMRLGDVEVVRVGFRPPTAELVDAPTLSRAWAAMPMPSTRRSCALNWAKFSVGEWTAPGKVVELEPIVLPDPRMR